MQINFQNSISVSPSITSLLEGLLEPVIEDRISAAEALSLLLGGQEAVPSRYVSVTFNSKKSRPGKVWSCH